MEDVDKVIFDGYFKKEFGQTYEEKGLSFEEALKAKWVIGNDQLTLAGLLFFGKDPQSIKPAFTIKAVAYYGNGIEGNEYRDKPRDLKGTLPQLFEDGMRFLKSNLHHIQAGQVSIPPGNSKCPRLP